MDLEFMRKSIRRLRLEKNMTQADLAKQAGLSAAYIGYVERGERIISLKSLIKIANALDATASQIIPTEKDIMTAKIMEKYNELTPEQQDIFIAFVDAICNDK